MLRTPGCESVPEGGGAAWDNVMRTMTYPSDLTDEQRDLIEP